MTAWNGLELAWNGSLISSIMEDISHFVILYKSLVRSYLEYANSVWFPKRNKKSAHLTIAERCTPTNQSMVTTIHSLFDLANKYMYDGGGVN